MTDRGSSFRLTPSGRCRARRWAATGTACWPAAPASLSVENFTEAIGRFSMGTPETLPNALPQVTISYLRSRDRSSHLALAIHRLASDAHPDGQLTATDDDGRPVVTTSYYCVRYDPVAERAVSYRDMYEAFAAVPLRPANGPVLSVEMTAATDPGAIDSLAVQAAALLLTGRPVCVLGAALQTTSMTDRLAFIDTVMSLLPYGFRARMTAATWTRATNQNHRFRLFFSGARRDAKDPDNVVYWGHPEQTIIDRSDTYAHDYFSWLTTGPATEKLSLLAGLTQPRSLANPPDVLEALDATRRDHPRAPCHALAQAQSSSPRTETEPDRSESRRLRERHGRRGTRRRLPGQKSNSSSSTAPGTWRNWTPGNSVPPSRRLKRMPGRCSNRASGTAAGSSSGSSGFSGTTRRSARTRTRCARSC